MKINLTKELFYFRKGILINLMRIFILFFCVTAFSFTPKSVISQNAKIKIDTDKIVTVDEVFDLIMNQTEYTFIYQVDMFKGSPKVNLKKGTIRINKLLEKSFSNENYIFGFSSKNTITIIEKPVVTVPQEIQINGTITDQNNNPLPGVSVYLTKDVSGSTLNMIRGTTTNFDGLFNLPAAVGDYLVVTNVGYEILITKVEANRTNYNLSLTEKVNVLGEVVLTGYQRISRERATGAYTKIKIEEVENTVTQNIGSVLQGVVPGIEVAEDADGNIDINDVVIRGVGSIDPESSTAPLVVVDGFPIMGGFNTINPNDIESINILRDAAAASIWGARAGNGVIVIATKKAKAEKGDLQVSFKSFVKMRSKMDLERNITRADSETTLAFEGTLWTPNGHGINSSFIYNSPPPITLTDRTARGNFSHGARAYFDAYNGHITQAELASTIERLSGIDNFKDVEKYLLTESLQKQYNLTIGTTGENSNTRVSVLYNDNTGSFIGVKNDQLLININNQYKFNDWLSISFNGMLDNSKTNNSGIGFSDIRNMAPYENLINSDGTYASVRGWKDPKYLEFLNTNIINLPYDDITSNPLRDARDTNIRTEGTNYRINTGLTIDIIKGLKFSPSFQYEKFQTKTKGYYGAETSRVVSSVFNASDGEEYDPFTGTIGSLNIPLGAQLSTTSLETVGSTLRGTLTYNTNFDLHAISALAGYERISSTTKGTGGAYVYGFDKETNTFEIPDNMGFTPWSGVGKVGITDGRFFSQRDRRFLSYFGNVGYTYDGKYTVTGSARSDGANFIVEDKSMRFNPMWSFGVSWNAKNEEFLKDVDYINYLKLRVTNGENGNLVGSVATKPTITLYSAPDFYTKEFIAYLNSLGNPDLRWERINTLNIGVDFEMFDKKLYGAIDVYNKKSKELIATIDIPSTLGLSTSQYNVGEMTNKGIELNLNSDFSFSNGMLLSSSLIFSHNKSEVTSLKDFFIYPRGLAGFPYVEGNPYQPVYAFEYGGMQTIDSQPIPYPTILGQNGELYGMDENIGQNGEDGRDVLKYMGTTVAPTIVGWNSTLRYKNFTLNARLIGKFGHKFRRPTYRYSPFVSGIYHEDLEGLMAGNHDAMGLPKLNIDYDYYSYRWGWYISDLDSLVEDAAHIRFKQIYLSYDFDQKLLSKIGISNVRFFAQADNLGNLWEANDHGIDPEFISGVRRAPEKTFSLGLNIDF